MTTTHHPKRRKLIGIVVSDKMEKTVVVRVDRVKTHPSYGKHYHVSRTVKAHDERNEYHLGDRVVIEETRPLSAEKRWRVLRKLGVKNEVSA